MAVADAELIQALFPNNLSTKVIISAVKTHALRGNWKLLICNIALNEHVIIEVGIVMCICVFHKVWTLVMNV